MNENELWLKVSQEETAAACQEYLAACPDGQHAKDVQNKLKIINGVNAIQLMFLKKYVQEGLISLDALERAGLAEAKLAALREQMGLSESKYWNDVVTKGNDAEACRKYLKSFPKGEHAAEVRSMLDRLEDAPWYEARQAGTIEALEDYMRAYPGRHDMEAQQLIDQLMRKKISQQAEAAWQQTCAAGTEEALLSYLRDYPGFHDSEVREKLERLRSHKGAEFIIQQMKADPNALSIFEIQEQLNNGAISIADLEQVFGPQKTQAILNFQAPSILPVGGAPVELSSNTTEVYFWGTPSSGKTCALGGIISNAGRKGILEKLQCSGYDYMTRLSNIFDSKGYCTFPDSTSISNIQEMMMRLYDDKKKSHNVTLVDLAGELFRCVYKQSNNMFLDEEQTHTLEAMLSYLNDKRNKKMHFFVVEYGAQDKKWEGLTMANYLTLMVSYLESQEVIKRSTVGIYVLVTKCDKIPCAREERPRLAYEFVQQELGEFWGPLQRICQRNGVADLKVLSYSVGDVFAQKLCKFDPSDTEKVLEKIFVHTPAEGGLWSWLRG